MPLFGAADSLIAALVPPPIPVLSLDVNLPSPSLVGAPINAALRQQLQQGARNALQQLHNAGQIMSYGITNTTGSITNAELWPAWNITFTGGSATSTTVTCAMNTTNQLIWTAWSNAAATISTTLVGDGGMNTAIQVINSTINNAAWGVWNNNYGIINDAAADAERIRRYSRRNLTEAELIVALEREKNLRLQAEKRQREALEAVARAEKLLRSCLTAQQVEDLEKKNCFYVDIPREGGKKERYRIDRGTHGNVKQLDEKGSILRSFCIQPDGVPVPDSMLTQKLWLEASDETREKFWETANITHLVREKEVPAHIPRRERHAYARAHGLLH